MLNIQVKDEKGMWNDDRVQDYENREGQDNPLWDNCERFEASETNSECILDGPMIRQNLLRSFNASRQRDEVLDMVSIATHDIRGSLVSIGAALKLIKKGYYGEIEKSVGDELGRLLLRLTGLSGIIEELLSRSFCLRGDLDSLIEELDLKKDVVDPVLKELSEEIYGICSIVHNGLKAIPQEKLKIKGNRFWLKAIFRNLLKNAIKHGGKGTRIAIGLKESKDHFMMNVYNTGTPVPEQYRSRLFNKFGHISRLHEGHSEGMGLGLYLVKQIVEKHGGNIWYEAKECGSNFTFSLPKA
jgi:signal transduction histidine kinase